MLNILIPMAGSAKSFEFAGYSFPKPVIDVHGKTMIEVVVNNLRPSVEHRFIFVCFSEHYKKYDLYNVFKNATNGKFETVCIGGPTGGQACTALTALKYINNEDELLIANSDQIIEVSINDFLARASKPEVDGLIMTFKATHPKWSFVRTDGTDRVVETAEKKVISDNATAGLYYFKRGSDFVDAAEAMIHKDIKYNNQFYLCPAYNELVLAGKNVSMFEIPVEKMYSMGTPEELQTVLREIEEGKLVV